MMKSLLIFLIFMMLGGAARCSEGFTVPRLPCLLAISEPDTAAMEWLRSGMVIVTIVIGIAVGVQQLRGDKRRDRDDTVQQILATLHGQQAHQHREMHLAGQPVGVQEHHEPVRKPDFEQHAREIWEVINGLRMAVGRIEKSVGENTVLREANSERLVSIAAEVGEQGKQIARLCGLVEHLSSAVACPTNANAKGAGRHS